MPPATSATSGGRRRAATARTSGVACRRQCGPSSSTIDSLSASHALRAPAGRLPGSLASMPCTQATIAGWRSGRRSESGGGRSFTWCWSWRDRRVRAVERMPAREQLVGDDAGRVEIGLRPDVLFERLLGRRVGRRAGGPEVGDLRAPVRAQEHVWGFRAPCTTPWADASASAASMPSSTPATCASVSRPTKGRNDPRSRYSIAMHGTPSCSKYSNTVTLFGWASAGGAAPGRAPCSTFRATSRSSDGCRARCTDAAPPCPRRRTISL